MAIAALMSETIRSSSFIRKMFETGLKLKEEFGADAVCDFSLGNPSLQPPEEFLSTLARLAQEPYAGKFSYMPNAGYPDVRRAMAGYLHKQLGFDPGANGVIMTCGAGGGLNITLKTLLNPADEILASLPCFMEYRFYAENHGGILKTVACKKNFDLDLDAFARSLNEKTAAIIINSPNNPSGFIYPEASLQELAALLDKHHKKTGRRVYIICDEPYRAISFGKAVPSIALLYPHTIVINSYSKELSIPGERIGYVAIHPGAEDAENFIHAAIVANRILGFVNAPALMQKTIAQCLGMTADVAAYKRKRDLLCPALIDMGYTLQIPDGTFYAFPEAPQCTDLEICDALLVHKILVVPGRGFGMETHFRIAFCVDDEVIKRSLNGFEKALKELR